MKQFSATEKAVIGLEAFVGLTAIAGGVLLMIRPDGSLLAARTSALAHTPFRDWLVPGFLLALFGGGGTLPAAVLVLQKRQHARQLVLLSGAGMVVAEAVEGVMIGFQPLQPLVAVIGLGVLVLGWRLPRPRSNGWTRE
jgi:hypothetical protein